MSNNRGMRNFSVLENDYTFVWSDYCAKIHFLVSRYTNRLGCEAASRPTRCNFEKKKKKNGKFDWVNLSILLFRKFK